MSTSPPPLPSVADPVGVVAYLDAIGADLDAVTATLARLDAGQYGACRRCGQPLADDLLATDPTATQCPTPCPPAAAVPAAAIGRHPE